MSEGSNGNCSASSEATVKWRDTMDIEFSMRQSLENAKKGEFVC